MTNGDNVQEERFVRSHFASWKFDVTNAMLSDGRLLASDFRIGVALLRHLNSGTGLLFPSHATLAALAHMSPRNVIKCLERLRVAGWVRWDRGNRQLANEYRFDEQTIADQLARMKVEETERKRARKRRSLARSDVNSGSPQKRVLTRTAVHVATRTAVHTNTYMEQDSAHLDQSGSGTSRSEGKADDQAA